MDSGRFDDLARSLGRSTSRRRVVAGALVAAALGVVRPGADAKQRGLQAKAAAICKGPYKNCSSRKVVAGASLSGCDLSGRQLAKQKLNNIVVSSASLSRADLSRANLDRAVMSSACLRDANLSGASLRNAVLSGADLRGANLDGADLTGAVVKESQLLSITYLTCATTMPNGKKFFDCWDGQNCCGGYCTDQPCESCNDDVPGNQAVCPAGSVCCSLEDEPAGSCCPPENPVCCPFDELSAGYCCLGDYPTCCPADDFWQWGYCSDTGICDCPNGSCLTRSVNKAAAGSYKPSAVSAKPR